MGIIWSIYWNYGNSACKKKKKNPYQMLLHRYIIFHNAASNRLSACGADRPAAVITCLEAWLWSQSRTVLNKMKNWAPHGIKRQLSKIQSRSFEIQRPSSALFSASRASDSSGSGYKPQPAWVCVRSEACCEVRDGRKATWCFCIVGQCQEEKNLSYWLLLFFRIYLFIVLSPFSSSIHKTIKMADRRDV